MITIFKTIRILSLQFSGDRKQSTSFSPIYIHSLDTIIHYSIT